MVSENSSNYKNVGSTEYPDTILNESRNLTIKVANNEQVKSKHELF